MNMTEMMESLNEDINEFLHDDPSVTRDEVQCEYMFDLFFEYMRTKYNLPIEYHQTGIYDADGVFTGYMRSVDYAEEGERWFALLY